MQQWVAEVAYDTHAGPKRATESYYLPTIDDVRAQIAKNGGYPLNIRPHERSSIERMFARSSWWQVQLLRGIQFRSTSTSPGVALWTAGAKNALRFRDGSSHAAPWVAASLALLRREPTERGNVQAAIAALKRASRDLGPRGPDPVFGAGLLRLPAGACATP